MPQNLLNFFYINLKKQILIDTLFFCQISKKKVVTQFNVYTIEITNRLTVFKFKISIIINYHMHKSIDAGSTTLKLKGTTPANLVWRTEGAAAVAMRHSPSSLSLVLQRECALLASAQRDNTCRHGYIHFSRLAAKHSSTSALRSCIGDQRPCCSPV